MPAGFERCRRQGGQIRTVKGPNKRWKVPAGRYRHICFLPNGKTYKGHLKKLKKKK